MEDFIKQLNEGNFRLPVCSSCKTAVWPPFANCPHCFSRTSLEIIDTIGTVIEFTKSHIKGVEGTFGLIEIAGIKLIGSFDTPSGLSEGIKVKMTRCGIRPDGTPLYVFEPIKH